MMNSDMDGRQIIKHCCAEYCLFADEAAEILRTNGYDVAHLEGGWPVQAGAQR